MEDAFRDRERTPRERGARKQSEDRSGLRSELSPAPHFENGLREIIEHNIDGMVVIDAEGRTLFANPAAARMLGMDRKAMVDAPFGLPAYDVSEIELLTGGGEVLVAETRKADVYWNGREAVLLSLRDVTRRKRTEHDLRRAHDDLEARVAARTEELLRANERLQTEIAERNQAEERLRAGEARLRAILEDQTELICRYLPDGRLSYVNPAYARFFNKEPSELINTNFIPHIPDEDLAEIRHRIAELTPEHPVTQFEHRIIMDDASVQWQSWTHRAIFDEQGELAEYQAVGRPITKRKLAEQELKDARAFLRLIIDTVPNPIFVKDRRGEFTLVNQAMAEMYGSTVKDMIGKTGADFNENEEELEQFRKEDLYVLDNRRPLHLKALPITHASGERRWYTKTKLPLPGRDEVLGVTVDVTELLRAQTERARLESQMRQSQKMQALGTLAGGIAHDFNNMIYAMLGFTSLAKRREPDDPKVLEYLEQIESAGMRASELVRQILTFSRRTERRKTLVAVSPLVKEISRMIQATLPSSISVETDIRTENDAILGDPVQVHQVLLNLCTNAGHAMRETGGTLKIRLFETNISPEQAKKELNLNPGRYIELTVSDTGHGIPEDIRESVFDPFFTTKEQGEGTGMGLSVVHGIVETHGGTIRVESEPGRTTFTVLLPAAEADGECGCEAEAHLPCGTERVLFVDDESALRELARDMLGALGYRVTALGDPAEALRLVRERPGEFDILITDQTMPAMSGLELARAVRETSPRTPVLLLTGFSETATDEAVREAGVGKMIMKPVLEEDLARALRELLDA